MSPILHPTNFADFALLYKIVCCLAMARQQLNFARDGFPYLSNYTHFHTLCLSNAILVSTPYRVHASSASNTRTRILVSPRTHHSSWRALCLWWFLNYIVFFLFSGISFLIGLQLTPSQCSLWFSKGLLLKNPQAYFTVKHFIRVHSIFCPEWTEIFLLDELASCWCLDTACVLQSVYGLLHLHCASQIHSR